MNLPVAAMVAVLATALAAPADAALPEGNLLRNPGAEDAPGAADNSTVPVPGWTTADSFTAVAYGAPGFLSAGQAPSDAGANFFAGGEGSEISRGYQTIDVAANAQEIDACRVSTTASGYFGGFEGQDDRAGADVAFFGADGQVIDVMQTGYPHAADRGGVSGFLSYSQARRVPGGTRSIRFTVTAQRASGTYNDGYADNLSLTLAETDPPSGSGSAPIPVSGQSVVLDVVRGTVKYSYSVTFFFPGGPCAISPDQYQAILDQIAVFLAARPVIDATHGVVELTAAAANGELQKARFSKGAFRVLQPAAAAPLTELVMRGGRFSKCTRGSQRVVRRLFGEGKGRFRTRGRFSSATVRGTTWRTIDRCDGTLTRVPRSAAGSKVTVRDLVRRRTVTLRAGESYLAKRRG